MIGDIIESIIEGWLGERIRLSGRAIVLWRLFWGFLGAALSVTGVVVIGLGAQLTRNAPMRISFCAMLVFFGCFWLFNVALYRAWRWPARLFVVSFAAMFLARLLFGP